MDEKVLRYPEILIRKTLWYIGDFTNPTRPKLLPRDYISKALAKRAIRDYLKKDYPDHVFHILQGEEALKHVVPIRKYWISFRFIKYEYPPERLHSRQKMKTYRTVVRRKLKRLSRETIKRKYPNLIKLL